MKKLAFILLLTAGLVGCNSAYKAKDATDEELAMADNDTVYE